MGETGVILSIFAFYAVIIVLMGLIGGEIVASNISALNPDEAGSVSSLGFFFEGIAFSITGIPAWANFLLFMPLGVTLVYIFARLVRGGG